MKNVFMDNLYGKPRISLYEPYLSDIEKNYLIDAFDSGWISSKGKYIKLFEKKFADYIGCNFALSINNGTAALHTTLLSCGVNSGDHVIVPSISYIATINAVLYCNAIPVCCNVDKSLCLDAYHIEELVSKYKPKAIIVAHLYGLIGNMVWLKSYCQSQNIKLIEDCAEALGSQYLRKMAGTYGDAAIFSFYGNKTISTGEGGCLITDNPIIYKNAVKYKGQGIADSSDPYFHDVIGYNYRMTNLCAAIGYGQILRINEIINKKQQIWKLYDKKLKIKNRLKIPKFCEPAPWLYTILCDNFKHRSLIEEKLKLENIETRKCFLPFRDMPSIQNKIISEYDPIATDISNRLLCLPSYPNLTNWQIEYICEKINATT